MKSLPLEISEQRLMIFYSIDNPVDKNYATEVDDISAVIVPAVKTNISPVESPI